MFILWISCPPQFQPRSATIPFNTVFPYVVKQSVEKINPNGANAFELSYENANSMLYKEFIAQTVLDEHSTVGVAELEDLAWATLEQGNGGSIYSMNNSMSLFADSRQWLNLNKFTRAESLIHSIIWIKVMQVYGVITLCRIYAPLCRLSVVTILPAYHERGNVCLFWKQIFPSYKISM